MDTLEDLHAPLIPILRHILALAPLPSAGVALDLACGPGLKAPLLAEACGPGVRLVGVDIDYSAIRAATAEHSFDTAMLEQVEGQGGRPLTMEETRRPGDKETERSSVASSPCPRVSLSSDRLVVGRRSSVVGVVGDALALPLRDGCCAAAFCIAALSLFADRQAALRELRRVLVPSGVALLVMGAQMWVQITPWPADLATPLATAYAQALADGATPLHASPDLSSELTDLLIEAGFTAPLIRAFSLDCRTPHGNLSVAPPLATLAAELPLLPWPTLRPLLAERLAPDELERCDTHAATPEVELCALALAAQARTI